MPDVGFRGADERAWYTQGRRLFEAGEDETALELLCRLRERRPYWADVHYLVGLLHERRGQLEEATHSLERALEINPRYAECQVALASVYEQRGLFERSRELGERLRQQARRGEGPLDATTSAKLANLQAALGDAYREAGELREAIEAYRKALERAPGFHDIRRRLAVTLREAGRPRQAIAELRRVLRANPTCLGSAVQLGVSWYSLGRVEQARSEWNAVLERDPSRDDARMYLRMVPAAAEGSQPPEGSAAGDPPATAGPAGDGDARAPR